MSPDDSQTGTTSSGGQAGGGAAVGGYYSGIDVFPDKDDPRFLVLIAVPGAGKVPERMLALRKEYDQTCRVVGVLFDRDKETRIAIFKQLHMAADRAFRGPFFDLDDGAANLASVRDIITDRAHKVRDSRLNDYTAMAGVFGVVPLLIGVVLLANEGFGYFGSPVGPDGAFDPVFGWILAAFWIPAGAAISVWAEFALRMQGGMTFDQLLQLDPSRWQPRQRVLITVGISFIFGYLLYMATFQVGLGGVLMNEFITKKPLLSLAVGGVTGLAFVAVSELIFRAKPIERK